MTVFHNYNMLMSNTSTLNHLNFASIFIFKQLIDIVLKFYISFFAEATTDSTGKIWKLNLLKTYPNYAVLNFFNATNFMDFHFHSVHTIRHLFWLGWFLRRLSENSNEA